MIIHTIATICVCMGCVWAAWAGDDGGTTVARWNGGKKAAFMLMFDDNCPTHLTNAIPELQKRNFVGTFYVVPGQKGLWTPAREKAMAESGMVLANHTFSHTGAPDFAGLEDEIRKCSEAINRLTPNGDRPHLVSFGIPGGLKPGMWEFSKAQLQELLAKYSLIERPPFMGAAIHYKTAKDMTKVVDDAIEKGAAGYIVFHGVGGDWLAPPMADYVALLDHMAARREQLWVADHISVHKYQVEQKAADVKLVKKDEKQIQLTLACQADSKLYDQPLTLVTRVPAAWKKCQVTQGERKAVVEVVGGVARYEALPCAATITLASGD
jgi:peptidoglycan/xylan/chitin deacetylase (PgdA/CDA1 family)